MKKNLQKKYKNTKKALFLTKKINNNKRKNKKPTINKL